jgi:hypothetical protein
LPEFDAALQGTVACTRSGDSLSTGVFCYGREERGQRQTHTVCAARTSLGTPESIGPADHRDRGLRGVDGDDVAALSSTEEREEAAGGGTDVGVTPGMEGRGLLGGRELRKRNQL